MRDLPSIRESLEAARLKAIERLERKKNSSRSSEERRKWEERIKVLKTRETVWPLR